ncbi:MAG TPA: bidirectional hydrogenase complex protein HoxE [Oceanobacillus sp.]|nr:bidirectional hydrogenase complex protein HoxE [Oceanobacillus sp.]
MVTEAIKTPSEDKRWRLVTVTMRRHGYKPHALIETLHTVQEAFGYIDETALRYVAQSLKVPLSRVYGVATFYNHFALKPKGEHTCVVCLGTACYIKGSSGISERLQETFQIKPGETTPDNKLSLMVAHCVGMCWLAPVVLFDDEVLGEQTQDSAVEKVKEQMSHVS